MAREQFTRGSIARIYLDIVEAAAGAISQSPTCALRRKADGKWFQASDGAWVSTAVENSMTQEDSVNLPGRYYFDFDQDKETLASSREYLARLTNQSSDPDLERLEYRDLVFGPFGTVVAPELCAIQGTIYTAMGEPRGGALIRATIIPPYTDSLGRAVESGRVRVAYTNELGDFELHLVRGLTVRLEIEAAGYDRRVAVPEQSSVLFTDL